MATLDSTPRGPALSLGTALAALAIAGLSPLLAIRAGWAKRQTGRIFDSAELIGQNRQPFRRLRFAGDGAGAGWAVLFNLLRGDMAWVGPAPLAPDEAGRLAPEFKRRFTLRPGLISPLGVRKAVGIAYEDALADEMIFFFGQHSGSKLGLAARFLIARLLAGGKPRPVPETLDFFGVPIANVGMDEALDWIVRRVWDNAPSLVAFANPDCLNIAYRHTEYHRILTNAARVLPDGIGIKLGCRLLGVELRENVNGTDLFPRLCERAAREGLGLFLLGARPGVAAAAADEMRRRCPGLMIAGVRDGYFAPEELPAVLDQINQSGAGILLVAFGAPRQELWLAEQADRLVPPVRLGVGGLFDFYSGRIPRAPHWMREIGMEWLFRLMQEPGRLWRRYVIGNPLFLYRVWRQRMSRTSHAPAHPD